MDKVRENIGLFVLAGFGIDEKCHRERISIGNINKTYFIKDEDHQYVLQQLNPIFNPIIHYDIEAVTQHLANLQP